MQELPTLTRWAIHFMIISMLAILRQCVTFSYCGNEYIILLPQTNFKHFLSAASPEAAFFISDGGFLDCDNMSHLKNHLKIKGIGGLRHLVAFWQGQLYGMVSLFFIAGA